MVKPLVALLPTVFDLRTGQRARLLREQHIGSVIPDLVFGIWSGELPHYERLNTISRHILVWLSTQRTANSEDQLCDDLLLSRYAADSAVSTLKRVGAISSEILVKSNCVQNSMFRLPSDSLQSK